MNDIKNNQTLILIDGASYLYRAFHTMPILNSKGIPTGAVYGITHRLKSILHKHQPNYMAVVFNAPGKTFRELLYPDYKANRPTMPTELVAQIPLAHQMVQALGFPLLIENGVEADDVIGTLAKQAEAANINTLIFTGNKNLAQLVSPSITLIDSTKNTRLDVQGVQKKFGIPPKLIIDYLSLVGDNVGNVPGVNKVGPKTAVKWLNTYGSLEAVIENADQMKSKIGDNLRQALPHLPLTRRLLTIKCNMPLPYTPSQLKLRPAQLEKLHQLYTELDFKNWLDELPPSHKTRQSDTTPRPLRFGEHSEEQAMTEISSGYGTYHTLSKEKNPKKAISPDGNTVFESAASPFNEAVAPFDETERSFVAATPAFERLELPQCLMPGEIPKLTQTLPEHPREMLNQIINHHSTALCDDVNHLETLLHDKCGNQYQREIFMLINALRENVVTDLLNAPPNINQATLLYQLTQRLYNNLGLDKTLAQWVVQTWAIALNQTPQNGSQDEIKNDSLSTDNPLFSEPKKSGPENTLERTEEFIHAYELMENTKQCVFITGKAGTGKSTLLQYFKNNTQKKIAVLAPTGVAALNVGGATLHSFFKLPPRRIHPNEIKASRSKKRRKLYQSIDTIVIDEVSMVRADMIDVIDRFMRLNGKHTFKPFGGTQMIFIGDLFQLPPIVSDQEEELFTSHYQSPFFFSAKVFEDIDLAYVELMKVYRQKEQKFINLLNSIRNNQVDYSEIQRINQLHQPQFVSDINDYYITLTTTNSLASQINTAHLKKLPTQQYQFNGEINGKFDKGTLPTELVLCLKEGAQVMFTKNDAEGRWVNGTLGRIKTIRGDEILVETPEHKIYQVKQVKWEILGYQFDDKTQRVKTDVIGSFTQYPLRLAWAITIHKSQGKQFDKVIIDLGYGTFAHGQLYVALSRCKTLEGLILKTQVRPKDVIVDKRVIAFSSSLSPRQLIEDDDIPPF